MSGNKHRQAPTERTFDKEEFAAKFVEILLEDPDRIQTLIEGGNFFANRHWAHNCPCGDALCGDCHSGDTDFEVRSSVDKVLSKVWKKAYEAVPHEVEYSDADEDDDSVEDKDAVEDNAAEKPITFAGIRYKAVVLGLMTQEQAIDLNAKDGLEVIDWPAIRAEGQRMVDETLKGIVADVNGPQVSEMLAQYNSLRAVRVANGPHAPVAVPSVLRKVEAGGEVDSAGEDDSADVKVWK